MKVALLTEENKIKDFFNSKIDRVIGESLKTISKVLVDMFIIILGIYIWDDKR
jgi:hypothetical protein